MSALISKNSKGFNELKKTLWSSEKYRDMKKNKNNHDNDSDKDNKLNMIPNQSILKRRISLLEPTENFLRAIKSKENSVSVYDFYKKKGEFLTNYLRAICKEPSDSLLKDTKNSAQRSCSMIETNSDKAKINDFERRQSIHNLNWDSSSSLRNSSNSSNNSSYNNSTYTSQNGSGSQSPAITNSPKNNINVSTEQIPCCIFPSLLFSCLG